MRITSATFGVSHKKESYLVDMTVQDTDKNKRRAVVTVVDKKGRAILNESMSGRQLICQETAKNAVRKAIKSQSHEKH